jgi:hypothetical protein
LSSLPRVIDAVSHLLGDGQIALLSGDPPPMINQLVPCHAHQPGHVHLRHAPLPAGGDRSHEGLGGEIFSDHGTATAGQEVPIDLGQRPAVDGHNRIDFEGLFKSAHTTSSFVDCQFRTCDLNFPFWLRRIRSTEDYAATIPPHYDRSHVSDH